MQPAASAQLAQVNHWRIPMLRTLIDCSRLMLESPWLMLLGLVIVIVPGGLLLMPALVTRVRSAKTAMSRRGAFLIEPVSTNPACRVRGETGKSSFIPFVPSVGKFR